AVAHSLRSRQTKPDVLEGNSLRTAGDMPAAGHAKGLAIDPRRLDRRDRRHRLIPQTRRIRSRDPEIQRKPDSPRRVQNNGAVALDALHTSQPVRNTVLPYISFGQRALLEFGPIDA